MELIDAETLAVIKDSLKDVVDTFFKTPIIIMSRNPKMANYGEDVIDPEPTPHTFNVMYQYTVASDGRYITVQRSEKGQEVHDGWRIYIWQADLDSAGVVINAETDSVVINGKEYEIRFASPSAYFGNLGALLFELDVHFNQ